MTKAIVVGAGMGGISAALRLLARGYQVELVEAGETAGGRARVFESEGYTFDAGPTVVTAPYLFDELFEIFGEKREEWVEFKPVDPFYRIDYADGSVFDYVGDEDRLMDQIRQLNPDDVDGYRKLLVHAQKIFDVGYTGLADRGFSRVGDMLRILPDLAKLSAYRSVYSLVSRYIKDERLRQALSFEPLLVGGNPVKIPGIYLLIHWLERKWGVHYAMGGTGAIVTALLKLFTARGGTLRFNAPVSQIRVENGATKGITLDNGTEINADLVVCNADPTTVYDKLIDDKYLKGNKSRSVRRKSQSMSLFVAYFGAKKRYENLAHHTVVLGPRYGGLLKDIFDRKVLADDFSLYLHAPCRSDNSMAPEGHDAFYVLSPVPNQKSGIDWAERADDYRDAIIDSLEERMMPGLRENLTTCFSVDPRYFAGEMRSPDGAAFGLEPKLTQSAYFRYHNQSKDVGGLFFVGASTHPGAGMPGVILSAKVMEREIFGDIYAGEDLPQSKSVSNTWESARAV
jgi:phytoene desaturase